MRIAFDGDVLAQNLRIEPYHDDDGALSRHDGQAEERIKGEAHGIRRAIIQVDFDRDAWIARENDFEGWVSPPDEDQAARYMAMAVEDAEQFVAGIREMGIPCNVVSNFRKPARVTIRSTGSLREVAIRTDDDVRWESGDTFNKSATFIAHGVEYEVLFTRLGSFGSNWTVAFRRVKAAAIPTSASVSEVSDVMSGVASAIIAFLRHVKPERLQLSPTNISRERLYRAVLRKVEASGVSNYEVDEVWYGNLMGEFVLKPAAAEVIAERTGDRSLYLRARRAVAESLAQLSPSEDDYPAIRAAIVQNLEPLIQSVSNPEHPLSLYADFLGTAAGQHTFGKLMVLDDAATIALELRRMIFDDADGNIDIERTASLVAKVLSHEVLHYAQRLAAWDAPATSVSGETRRRGHLAQPSDEEAYFSMSREILAHAADAANELIDLYGTPEKALERINTRAGLVDAAKGCVALRPFLRLATGRSTHLLREFLKSLFQNLTTAAQQR